MFLQSTQERNPRLIQIALDYHQSGLIPPNTYLIDYDTVRENARLLAEASRKTKIRLYFITKQIGHNPAVLEAIQEGGLTSGTCVDVIEAFTLASNGVRLGNAGHLVQLPSRDIETILTLKPEVITVFGYEKAEQISKIASRHKQDVKLLLRVYGSDDFFHPGQVGGIHLSEIKQTAARIDSLPFINVVGVTSYPCLTFDSGSKQIVPLPNLDTVLRAGELLQAEMGEQISYINTPGTTSVKALSLLETYGVTHAEPGHALTGTTHLHAFVPAPESPAIVYVSEVSHKQGNTGYLFGGGFYSRSGLNSALVGSQLEHLHEPAITCTHPPAENIDYYARLDNIPARVHVGDTVIAAFRTQIFVTRSHVAVVKGLHSGEPTLLSLWDSRGRKVHYGIEQDTPEGIQ
jgi:predicted amino acid racemase